MIIGFAAYPLVTRSRARSQFSGKVLDRFPGRAHVAFSHWSAGTGGSATQAGVLQYCSHISGEAFSTFVNRHPSSDSPEPAAG